MTDTLPGNKTIDFHGRKIEVRFPQPEQVMIWQRVMGRLAKMSEGTVTAEQAIKAMDRARSIIDSLIVNEADTDWLDDEMIDGNIGLQEAADIITKAVKAFTDDKVAPATAAKKTTARRKRATTA